MNKIKTVEKGTIRFLMDFDYNNVLGRLMFVLGKDALFFADISVDEKDVTWFTNDNDIYFAWSETDEMEKRLIDDVVDKKIVQLSRIISGDSIIGPYVDKILSYPSNQYIYYKKNGTTYDIILAGWGCGDSCHNGGDVDASREAPHKPLKDNQKRGSLDVDTNAPSSKDSAPTRKGRLSTNRKPSRKGRSFLKKCVVLAILGIVITFLVIATISLRNWINQRQVNQERQLAFQQIKYLMDQAQAEEKKGRNYDVDYYEWYFMNAYLLYTEAHSTAMKENISTYADTINLKRQFIARELQVSLTRIQRQYADAVLYNFADSTFYRLRADSLEWFLRNNSIIYGKQ